MKPFLGFGDLVFLSVSDTLETRTPIRCHHHNQKLTVPRLKGTSVATSKWLYKNKHAANGSIEKFKARLTAGRFFHKEEMDYEETFVLVVNYTSI